MSTSKTNNPRIVSIGITGKNALFTQRGKDPEVGYVRVGGKTISGFVPGFGTANASKIFYPWASARNARITDSINDSNRQTQAAA